MHTRVGMSVALGLGLIVGAVWLLSMPLESARAADLCVDSYASIQDAIDNADDGDIVRIPSGLYTETLLITDSILLQGGWNSGCSSRTTIDPALTVINANSTGSVVSITQANPALEGLTLTGGWSTKGGGVFVDSGLWSATLDYVVVNGNVISATASEEIDGAGIYAGNGSTIRLNHVDVVSNTSYAHPSAPAMGGGLYADTWSSIHLTATHIMSNIRAPGTSLRGGGIGVEDTATLVFYGTENLIAYNVASFGGGIGTLGAGVSGVIIINNTAQYGGGISASYGNGIALANNVIAGNSALYGSGLYLQNCRMLVTNNTLVGNAAGAGVELSSPGVAPTLTNNIVVGYEVGIKNSSTTVSPTMVTNDVWNNSVANYQGVLTGTSDVSVDPLFVNPGSRDYHLLLSSQLVNAGTTVPWLIEDLDGVERPMGTGYDIGAYEVWLIDVFLPMVLGSY